MIALGFALIGLFILTGFAGEWQEWWYWGFGASLLVLCAGFFSSRWNWSDRAIIAGFAGIVVFGAIGAIVSPSSPGAESDCHMSYFSYRC